MFLLYVHFVIADLPCPCVYVTLALDISLVTLSFRRKYHLPGGVDSLCIFANKDCLSTATGHDSSFQGDIFKMDYILAETSGLFMWVSGDWQ